MSAAVSLRPSGSEYVSFAVAPEAIDWWQMRLGACKVPCRRTSAAFSAHGGPGGRLCLHRRHEQPRPRLGAGMIHHVAFRARDEADLAAMADMLQARFGIATRPIKDRYYFRSIYFRGPDGILIEVSTDGPGFLIDETRENLGTCLIFPPSLQDRQEELLRILPLLDRIFASWGG